MPAIYVAWRLRRTIPNDRVKTEIASRAGSRVDCGLGFPILEETVNVQLSAFSRKMEIWTQARNTIAKVRIALADS